MSESTDQEPLRQTMITTTVTTGNVGDQGNVTGLHVDKIEAHSITINNGSGGSGGAQSKWAIVITGVLSFLAAVFTNVATNVLPESWRPHLWMAWPLAGIVTLLSIWYALREQSKAASPILPMRQEDRAAILGTVRRIWIDGVLKHSLWNDALIELRLSDQPDAMHRPYGLTFQQGGRSTDLVPGTTVQQVYEEQGKALLILGEPGSGKTTLLLELLQFLLAAAEQDKNHPIPVVFNLATWSKQPLPLDSWLALELNLHYGVNKKAAQNWIKQGLFLPLLDGLDEVAEKQRILCVEAINAYREAQPPSTPLVVCCRWAEYQTLPQLRVQRAIRAEPLTRPQIDAFLKQAGNRLAGVRAVVKDDPSLYELLEIPLMLSITALTFADQPATVLRRTLPPGQRRAEMFDAFITRQFQPPPIGRGVDERYAKQKTLRWLRWVAKRMKERDQSIYWIEFMQSAWLPVYWMQWIQRRVPLFFGGILGYVISIFAVKQILRSVLNHYPIVSESPLSQPVIGNGSILDQYATIKGPLMDWVYSEVNIEVSLISICVGIIASVIGTFLELHIMEGFNLNWRTILTWRFWRHILLFSCIGAFAGAIIIGWITWLGSEQVLWSEVGSFGIDDQGMPFGSAVSTRMQPEAETHTLIVRGMRNGGISGCLIVGLLVGVFQLIQGKVAERRTQPNEGILRSGDWALWSGLASIVSFGAMIILIATMLLTLGVNSAFDLIFSTLLVIIIVGCTGLIVSLRYGGAAVLKHYTLRFLLWLSGTFPWNIARFLDSCAQRRLVQRVGGGWRFPHNLIRDHVAELEVERLLKESEQQHAI